VRRTPRGKFSVRLNLKRDSSAGRRHITIIKYVIVLTVAFGILGIGVAIGGFLGISAYQDGARSGTAAVTRLVSTVQIWVDRNVIPDSWEFGSSDHPAPVKIHFDVKFDDFETIRAKRDEALSTGVLITSDEDLVPAKITIDGKELKAKIRLKGDHVDHLETDKWSFRVELTGDDRAFGMRRFSVQNPETREFQFEQTFLDNLRYEGILAPRYEFVEVTLNGENWGVYALEEFFGKELIESMGRRTGVLVAFEEQYFWEHISKAPSSQFAFGVLALSFRSSNAYIDVFDQGRISKNPELQAQADKAVSNIRKFQSGEVAAGEVFDLERMATYLAIVELWMAHHSLVENNFRFYFNPISGLLEPVGFDGQPTSRGAGTARTFNLNGKSDFLEAVLDDPKISGLFLQELERVSSKDYLTEIQGQLAEKSADSFYTLQSEFLHIRPVWPAISSRQALIRKLIDPSIAGIVYGVIPEDSQDTQSISLSIGNPLTVPVEATSLTVGPVIGLDGETSQPIQIDITDPEFGTVIIPRRAVATSPLEFWTVEVPISDDVQDLISRGAELTVGLRIVGQETVRTSPVVLAPIITDARRSTPASVSIDDVLTEHPYLQLDTPSTISINGGNWDVVTDLIVPSNYVLSIKAGTTLRFDEDVKLISESALHLQGREDAPVVLDSMGATWGGVFVQRADEVSLWQHAYIRNTKVIPEPGRAITGAVTFSESPLTLRNVTFENSDAEDMLNVVLAGIDFENISFKGGRSDGFDGDAVIGRIDQARFTNIGGDGLDVSTSQITGSGLTFVQIGDKAISIGESSKAEFSDVKVTGAGIGIASKDLSFVTVNGVQFEDISSFALASYQKKPEYGPAALFVNESNFNIGRTVVDETGELRLNGEILFSVKEDVEELFTAAGIGS
jgi:hypothetical protein